MNYDSFVAPVWQLPWFCHSPHRTKYHCFDMGDSLCGRYSQDTHKYADKDITVLSGYVLHAPHKVCGVCYRKWRKLYESP